MPDKPKKAKVPQPRHPGRAWAKKIAARYREALARTTPEQNAASERAALARWQRAHPEAVEKEREFLRDMGFEESEARELAAASAYHRWRKEAGKAVDALIAELRKRKSGKRRPRGTGGEYAP
jgi:hypothetical protein